MNPEVDNHAWACLGDEPESERHMPYQALSTPSRSGRQRAGARLKLDNGPPRTVRSDVNRDYPFRKPAACSPSWEQRQRLGVDPSGHGLGPR